VLSWLKSVFFYHEPLNSGDPEQQRF
jgi:hypothetical protein